MRAAGQWHCLVQEIPRPRDDLLAAGRVVPTDPGRAFLLRNGIGAVEGVVQAAPARVGGIEGVACVGHRHDELGSRNLRDLVVDMRRLDAEVGPLGHEIADVGEKATVGVGIDGLAAARRRRSRCQVPAEPLSRQRRAARPRSGFVRLALFRPWYRRSELRGCRSNKTGFTRQSREWIGKRAQGDRYSGLGGRRAVRSNVRRSPDCSERAS